MKRGILQYLATMTALVLAAHFAAAQSGGKAAAMVNGEAIKLADVDGAVEVFLKRQKPAQPMTDAMKRDFRRSTLEMMIEDRLMQQFLRKSGPKVDAGEVNKQIGELVGALKKDNRTLKDFLTENHQTEQQLRMETYHMLQWLAYVKKQQTDAVLKKYWEENKLFFDKVVVRASHILFRLPRTASETEKQAAKNKLLGLRKEIVAGKLDFAEAAKKYSDCPSSKNGGDMGLFPVRFSGIHDVIVRTAFSMRVGEVSDVVTTEFGFHLIKVTERKPGEASVFDKVKEVVYQVAAKELWDNIHFQQRKVAKIEILLP